MKSTTMLVGVLLATIAFAPLAHALQPDVEERPESCNQKLINCIDQATTNFDCCAYGADRTTYGLLSDYCAEAPLPSFGQVEAPASADSVPACLLIFNGTTTVCNGKYAVCLALTPILGAPAPAQQ
jgi:hypothetical protein